MRVVFIGWAALWGLALVARAAELHVAPSGADHAEGSPAQPVASLSRARELIRGIRRDRPDEPVTVTIHGGDYRFAATLALTTEDSGSDKAAVLWRAAPGERVRLLGGHVLTGWKPVSEAVVLNRLDPAARGAVREVNLKLLGIPDFGGVQPGRESAQLFYGKKYMQLARYPNEGWLRIASVPQEGELKFAGDFRATKPTTIGGKIAGKHYGRFTYDGDRPSRWLDPASLWIHGFWVWDYQDQYHPVEKLDTASKEVWPKPPYHFYGYHANARFRFLNVIEELDSPGEWYLDRDTGLLYFWPPEGGEPEDAIFAVINKPLFHFQDVRQVELQGFVFEAGRGSAIQISGGDNVRISGCAFSNFGDTAIRIEGGSHHLVRSCDLSELGAGGILLKGGDRKLLTPAGHAVENCEIHHIGRVQAPYRPAVHLDGVGLRVFHCFIHDCPHGGLGYSGNDHRIEFSEFTRIGYDAGDTGTIYSAFDWTYRGHIFRHNFFHHIHSPPQVHVGSMTIYLDLPAGGAHVYGNVFYDNQRAFFTNSGRDCLIENNIFVQCDPSIHFNSWRDEKYFKPGGPWKMVERLTDGIAYDKPPYSTRYPELLRLFTDGDPAIPTGNVVRGNVSTGGCFLSLHPLVDFDDVKVEKNLIGDPLLFTGSPTGDGKPNRYSQGSAALTSIWEKAGNLMIQGDPGFVDPEREDFRLKPESPAWKLGFKPIPFEQIGLQRDAFRKSLPLPSPIVSPGGQTFLGQITVNLRQPARSPVATIRYTLDGTGPSASSPVYSGPLKLSSDCTLAAAAFDETGARSPAVTARFVSADLAGGIFLSDLPAVDILAHPDLKRDCNYGAGKLRLGGKEYGKGLLLCPEATAQGGLGHATWILSGGLTQVRKFSAIIGIDDAMKDARMGSAVFYVESRRHGKWERLFESPVLKCGDVRHVEVELGGADQLRLGTTDGGDNIYGDHAVWAAAKLR